MVVGRGWGSGQRNGELSIRKYRVSVWEDEIVLDMDGGEDNTAMWVYLMHFFFGRIYIVKSQRYREIVKHETGHSNKKASDRHFEESNFQTHVSTCLLGKSAPASRALAPNRGHLSQQSCFSSGLPHFSKLYHRPSSFPSLKCGHFPWPLHLLTTSYI